MFEKTIEILKAKLNELDNLSRLFDSNEVRKYKRQLEGEIHEAILILQIHGELNNDKKTD
ncbi:MAG: hypothetical protein J7L26_12640 [Candidatus Aminicenantes bacterium]|nr:hypothetical protein [Candidatus Aminicenantes bacterium]